MNSVPLLTTVSSLLLLSSVVMAQSENRVWPLAYQNKPGEASQSAPFTIRSGHENPTGRSVTTLDSSNIPFGPGSRIDAIAWRRDVQSRDVYRSTSGTLKVTVGSIDDAQLPTATHRELLGDDKVRVFNGSINLPYSAPPAFSGQAAWFQLQVPFNKPWTYQGGDMAIDVHFEGLHGTTWRRDAVEPDLQVPGSMRQVSGHGCFGSGGFAPMTWCELDRAHVGGELVFHLEGGPVLYNNNKAWCLVSFKDGSSLPLSLEDFGTIPGCFLFVDPDFSIESRVADRSTMYGRARASLAVPPKAGLAGAKVLAQWAVFDGELDAQTRLTASNAVEVEVGAGRKSGFRFYGRTLWNYGRTDTEAQGLKTSPLNYVPVTRFSGTFVQ